MDNKKLYEILKEFFYKNYALRTGEFDDYFAVGEGIVIFTYVRGTAELCGVAEYEFNTKKIYFMGEDKEATLLCYYNE